MKLLRRAFHHELKQFNKISKEGQQLMLSNILFNSIQSIYAIFINAFLWRQTQDFALVALFNLSLFCLLPVGFYCNGHLLKHFSVRRMYLIGALLRAGLIGILMFTPSINLLGILLFGMGYGFTSGLFFSNKNLLTVELTTHANRIYFSSLDYISQTISNIIVPVCIGAFLIFGSRHELYTAQQGYYVIAVLMIIFSIFIGAVIKRIKVGTPDIADIVLLNSTKAWRKARGITILLGLINGLFWFLPVLLVLKYIGTEETLGSVQSIAAVVSGVVMYAIARSINTRFRIRMIILSIMALITGSTVLALSFNPAGIIFFIACMTSGVQLLLTETSSIILDLVDRENVDKDEKYKYVFDLEMVLNMGRVAGVLLFFFYMKAFSTDFAVQFSSLFFSLSLVAIPPLARAIEHDKHLVHSKHELAESLTSENKPVPTI